MGMGPPIPPVVTYFFTFNPFTCFCCSSPCEGSPSKRRHLILCLLVCLPCLLALLAEVLQGVLLPQMVVGPLPVLPLLQILLVAYVHPLAALKKHKKKTNGKSSICTPGVNLSLLIRLHYNLH